MCHPSRNTTPLEICHSPAEPSESFSLARQPIVCRLHAGMECMLILAGQSQSSAFAVWSMQRWHDKIHSSQFRRSLVPCRLPHPAAQPLKNPAGHLVTLPPLPAGRGSAALADFKPAQGFTEAEHVALTWDQHQRASPLAFALGRPVISRALSHPAHRACCCQLTMDPVSALQA